MGLLNYLLMIKDLKAQQLVMIIIFAIYIVSGDVSLQNSYSAGSSESHEDIYLHDMDYSNSASISSTSYSASSNAGPAEKSKNSSFEDIASMNSIDGAQGASLKIDAENLGYVRSIAGGESNTITFSYFAESGDVQANYFTPLSNYNEEISLINNKYRADLAVYGSKSYSYGTGQSISDNQSSLKHNISMKFLDKYNDIKSVLITGPENTGDKIPVNYTWNGYSSQRNYAVSGINLKVIPGNRTVKFWIEGKSSILEDKFSPDKVNDTAKYPAEFNTQGLLVLKNNSSAHVSNKTLIMQYRLNETD